MSELEHLTNIILTILSKDNQARNESEAYLQELQVKDLDQYTLVFIQLLNGILSFQMANSLCTLIFPSISSCSDFFLPKKIKREKFFSQNY